MAQGLQPNWSKRQQAQGAEMRDAWEAFFSAAGEEDSPPSALDSEAAARVAVVRARHEAELLRYPNVVGVGEGIRTRRGKPTGEPCLVVLVSSKLPETELKAHQRLPREIDGVPLDVVEVGEIKPLSE